MSTVVACPECDSKLSVPDGLAGQAVRCARCGTTFTAPDSIPGKSEALPASGQEPLSTRDRPFPAPPPPPPAPGEDLARSLRLSLDDDATSGERPDPGEVPFSEPEPPRSRPRPALNDEHDEMRECPNCGKQIYRDYVSCPFCGQRLTRSAGRRRASRRRRDADPHRGGLVLTLGIIGLAAAVSCWPLGFVFGPMAWIMGGTDLNRIKANEMDSEGEGMTQAGWVCGIIATALSLLVGLGCGSFWVLALMANAPRRRW